MQMRFPFNTCKKTIPVFLDVNRKTCFTGVEMSKASKQFKVPEQLANLYDFANSLDVRHFTHQGVQHTQSDELAGPRELGAWMAARGLSWTGARITPVMFETALQLRASVRVYLECDPVGRVVIGRRRIIRRLRQGNARSPENVRGGRVPAGVLRSVEAGDAAVVHVDAVREPDQDPKLSRAPARHRLRFAAKDAVATFIA